MGQCQSNSVSFVGPDKLFDQFSSLSDATKEAMEQSINAVVKLAINNDQFVNRSKWWKAYMDVNGGDLSTFFRTWLYYSPVPEGPEGGDEDALPNAKNLTGIPNGPGYYIEKWDWLANTTSGLALNGFDPDFRDWFVRFLNLRGDYIKSPSSKKSVRQWMSYEGTDQHPFRIRDYVIPKGGFKSFNEFFLRFIINGKRTVSLADKSNKFSVVSPSDGGIFYLTKSSDSVKEYHDLPSKRNDKFNLEEAFPGYGSHFVGGPILDTLLWFTDFHHFFSPVGGKVIAMNDYPGSYNYDFDAFDPYHPGRPKYSDDSDKVGWYSKLSTHRRFVWIFQTESMGLVGMAAIGFWGVGSMIVGNDDESSSSTWPRDVLPVKLGDTVEKGQYLGHFGYGGSSIVLAFQPTSVDGKTISYDLSSGDGNDSARKQIGDANNPIQVNAMQHIVTANVQP